MNTTTLRRWLRAQQDRDDPVGDLARDVAADPGCTARTPASLIAYVTTASCGYQPVIDAALRAADEWTRS